MASENWQAVVKRKQAEAAAKIPLEWRLPPEYTHDISEESTRNVLDVPRQCGLLSARQLEITENYDATALLEKIHSGQMTSTEVTQAFCIRAAIAQQVVSYLHLYPSPKPSCLISFTKTRCLTETFFDSAIKRAKELDKYLRSTKSVVGPLHGLPISLKVCKQTLRFHLPFSSLLC